MSSHGERRLLRARWSEQALAARSTEEIIHYIEEMPRSRWALEEVTPTLDLPQERVHRLKLFELCGRDAFAVVRGDGECVIGLLSSNGEWEHTSAYLYGFDPAWEEVIQILPLPQLYSKAVVLALVTRRFDAEKSKHRYMLYRVVVDNSDKIRIAPTIDAIDEDLGTQHVRSLPLPEELKTLAKFPVETRGPPTPEELERRIPSSRSDQVEQIICAGYLDEVCVLATDHDRLRVIDEASEERSVLLPARPYSLDIGTTVSQGIDATTSRVNVLITTEGNQLLSIDITDPVTQQSAPCPTESMVSATGNSGILLAHTEGLSLVRFLKVGRVRRPLLEALARSLTEGWACWLRDSRSERVPTHLGIWLDYLFMVEDVPDGDETARIVELVKDWVQGDHARALGRVFANRIHRWHASGSHWDLLRTVYFGAAHPFRREIDATMRGRSRACEPHAALLKRSLTSSFDVVKSDTFSRGDRAEAAIDMALSEYLIEKTISVDLEGSDELRGIGPLGSDDLAVLTRRTLLLRRGGECMTLPPADERSSQTSAPPRFCRRHGPKTRPLIGYENGIVRLPSGERLPSNLAQDTLFSHRCVDGFELRHIDRTFLLRRNGLEGVIELHQSRGATQLAVPLPAPRAMDVHPVDADVFAVVGERQPKIACYRIDGVMKPHSEFGLPDIPTCVRFMPDGMRLVAGTQNGLVLSFPWGGKPGGWVWTYGVRARIEALEPYKDRLLVVAPEREIVVLDKKGRRLWRLKNTKIRAAAWMDDGRLAIALLDGQIVIVRPTKATNPHHVIKKHRRRVRPNLEAAAELALGNSDPARLDQLNRSHRASLIARISDKSATSLPLADISARDLAVAARNLPDDVGLWAQTFEAATTFLEHETSGDRGIAAKSAAIAECLRRPGKWTEDRGFVVRRLKEVPDKVWSATLALWLHVIAANLLAHDDNVDWRRLLEDVAPLPPEVLVAAAALRPARLGPCATVVRAARTANNEPERLPTVLREFAQVLRGFTDDLAQVIYPLAELAATPLEDIDWNSIREWINLIWACPATAGRPLVNLTAAVKDSVHSAAPEHQSPLGLQQRWLQVMLGSRVRLDVSNVGEFYRPLVTTWANLLHERLHAAAQAQLQRLLSTTRLQVTHEFDGRSKFIFNLRPEGEIELDAVTVRLSLEEEDRVIASGEYRLKALKPEDPEISIALEAPIAYQRRIRLTVEIFTEDELHDRTEWPIEIRSVEDTPDAIIAQLPRMFGAVIRRVNEGDGEVVVSARAADLEVLATALGRPIFGDVRTDWREDIGPGGGVLYPSVRRAWARLSEASSPIDTPVIWLLPPRLAEKLVLHTGATLVRACRPETDEERKDVAKWLHGKGVDSAEAASLIARTGGDLRVCAAVVDLAVILADAMVDALGDDLGGVGPVPTAALLGAAGTADDPVRSELVDVAPLDEFCVELDRLELLRKEYCWAVAAVEFVRLVENSVGGPSELLIAFAGSEGLWAELEFARLSRLSPAVLRSLDRRLDARKINALIALGRLWTGDGGQKAFAAFLTAFQGNEFSSNARLSDVLDGEPAMRTSNHQFAFLRTCRDSLPEQKNLLIVMGPGVVGLEPTSNVFILDEASLRQVIAAGDWWRALLATKNAQRKDLASLNPFRSHGALKPGSPLFVGRRSIREDFRQNVTNRHFLLLGSRRIGKTSLMNQLYRDAHQRRDLHAFWVEGQGVLEGDRLPALHEGPEHLIALPKSEAFWLDHLRENLARIRKSGQIPVLFLNEIDGLITGDAVFLNTLRGEFENGLRMVAVGYSLLARESRNPNGFLYHLASDSSGGQTGYNLSVLEPDAGYELVDRLKEPPLDFWWSSDRAEEQGRRELVEHSFGIPWLLQDVCSKIVRRLTTAGRGVIAIDDVRAVVASMSPILEHFHAIEFEKLLAPERFQALSSSQRSYFRILTRFILLVLVRETYFEASPPADFSSLSGQPTGRFQFSASVARSYMIKALRRAPCTPQEQEKMNRHLEDLAMDEYLSALCLTLLMDSSFVDGQEFFSFQAHVYPIELWRAQNRGGRVIDDRILDTLWELVVP